MTSRFKPVNVYARAASIYHFALEGSLMGIWACYLPSIQDKLDIDDSSLGIAVLLMYFGTVVATQLAAVLTRRFGSRNSTFLGAIGFSVCLPFIALAPGFEVLCLVMFLYGYFMGVMDGRFPCVHKLYWTTIYCV
jgi:MFS family permease